MKISVAEIWPGQYSAIDDDTYDGAPDSSRRARAVGVGPSKVDAIADLEEQLAELDAEEAEQAKADCPYGGHHPRRVWECSCGFYRDPDAALEDLRERQMEDRS